MFCRRSRSKTKVVCTIGKLITGIIVGYIVCTVLRGKGFGRLPFERRCDSLLLQDVVVDRARTVNSGHKRNEKFLFVGVMTAKKYLSSRAAAVNRTWAETIPGKVKFFSSVDSNVSHPDLPLVSLPGVDDTYPPQKKAFLMLKYMYDNYIDRYEWFIRADDDVYIKGDQLEVFLRSINSSQTHYIGQSGQGNKEDLGKLYLDPGENYCMGGPSVIFSGETLRRIVPHISQCFQIIHTTHEDVEIGRCVHRFAKVNCTWSYDMQWLFYQNYSTKDAFKSNLNLPEVSRAISLHPIKTTPNMYRMHSHTRTDHIATLNSKVSKLKEEIGQIDYILSKNFISAETKMSNSYWNKATDYQHAIPWEYRSKSYYSSWVTGNEKRRIRSSYYVEFSDLMSLFVESVRMNLRTPSDDLTLMYGYRQVNPQLGCSYIVNLSLKSRKRKKRKYNDCTSMRYVYLRRPFGKIEFREDLSHSFLLQHYGSYVRKETLRANSVHCIVPLSGRFETFQKFLENFEEVFLKNEEDVKLVVVLFQESTEDQMRNSSVELIHKYQSKHSSVDIRLVLAKGKFSRGAALELGAAEYPDDALLMFLDVDLYIGRSLLYRCRENAIKGKQVYFPIIFSQYDPKFVQNTTANNHGPESKLIISDTVGFFRDFAYGMLCAYRKDIINVGGFDLSIDGWGLEDLDLYNKFLHSNLTIFRSFDVDLIHKYHEKYCDPKLSVRQYKMCIGSKSIVIANTVQLSKIVNKGKHNIDNINRMEKQ
ncbi:chondroitin sulfate synthase 1-like [Ptychodera flava]|uniref:chondroitin sulfate synthase 1-like n=1 Tax=Ptychodera flava TaxID=63121 RepID=UPI00396A68EC